MNEDGIVRKVSTATPKTRWKDCVSQGVRTIRGRNWTRLAVDRDK